MDIDTRQILSTRARFEEELARRAIDNGFPELAPVHQIRAEALRAEVIERPDPERMIAAPESVFSHKAFWIILPSSICGLALSLYLLLRFIG